MREIEIVDRIRRTAGRGHRDKRLISSIGDDCAILRSRPDEDLVFTTDFVIENRHFTLETHSAADIGHKALARSLSDLAAMGSEPVFCLVSLAVPARLGGAWIERFYAGLLALAARYKVSLAGGDLARADKIVADTVCCGRVPRARALLRSAAKPGDFIYVTGSLGASAHGLTAGRGAAFRRHLRPEPRIASGIELRRRGVKAGMDTTDGLALDLYRLCRESNVSADLDGHLPVARGASLEEALHGGDDYELIFTAPAKMKLPAKAGGVAVTRIGVIHRGRAGVLRFQGRPLEPRGFDHFA